MRRALIFVHQYFPPEIAGSARQLADLTRGLAEKGFSIQVVTGSCEAAKEAPARENLEGIEIYRVPKTKFSRDRAWGRILNAVTFFISAFFRLLGMERKALLVIGSDPPFLSLLGWFFKKIRGQRYVLIVSDAYPEIAVALGEIAPHGAIRHLLEGINRLAYLCAERIVVLGEKMQEELSEKYFSKNGQKIEVIHNWEDGSRIRPLEKSENLFRRKHNLLEPLVLSFSGNLGKIYDFEKVLALAFNLKEDSSIKFLFIGDGPERLLLENRARQGGLTNIQRLPYQGEEELPFSLTAGDIALLPLKSEAAGFCVPGKFYSALAAGLPVLAIAPEDCEIVRIIKQNDCGWHFPPHDMYAVAVFLKKLARDRTLLVEKGKNARACFDQRFSKTRAIQQYESLFSHL